MEAIFDSGARFSILPISVVKRQNLPYYQLQLNDLHQNDPLYIGDEIGYCNNLI